MSAAVRDPEALRGLTEILKLAYSGELAAALAYGGHARSVRDAGERARILQIEEEELHHRRQIGEMLAALGEQPTARLERRARRIGSVLALLCRVGGWLAPMYGAGKLESRNIREYETAARHARDGGRAEWVDCLLVMAEVEWEHEHYFRGRVLSHRFAKCLRLWPAPPPKADIRESFAAEGCVTMTA